MLSMDSKYVERENDVIIASRLSSRDIKVKRADSGIAIVHHDDSCCTKCDMIHVRIVQEIHD